MMDRYQYLINMENIGPMVPFIYITAMINAFGGDYHNLHAHMLIGTNTDMTYKEVKYGLGNVSVGDYQPIYDSEDVCKYVSKHIGKNVDYDIVFKEIS